MMRPAAVLALGAALALCGCAGSTLPGRVAGGTAVPAPPVPAAPAPAVARPAPPTPALAVPDTVPSPDALAVLAEIPEPLSSEGRASGSPAAAPAATDADGGQADVPVPAPTPVLGERALPAAETAADTAALAPSRPAAPPAGAAARDTCWRVQLAAWADRAKAERYRAAGGSQLAVPLVVEREAGLFKVRTADCLDGPAADALRRRARDAGFDGAFRFRGRKP